MANIESVTLNTPEFGHVIIMAHNEKPLGDDEWEKNYLSHVRAARKVADLDKCANIVFAEGKGPTAKQRAAGNAIFGDGAKYELKVAVVTTSMMVRGAVTALSWFNPLIKAYAPEAWENAMMHVRMDRRHHGMMVKALQEIRQKLGVVDVLERCLRELERVAA